MKFTGIDDKQERMEIIELKGHPFFYGVQFHPEFTSGFYTPNPSFYAFILASSGQHELIGYKSEFQQSFESIN